jgi:hypothetical protein
MLVANKYALSPSSFERKKIHGREVLFEPPCLASVHQTLIDIDSIRYDQPSISTSSQALRYPIPSLSYRARGDVTTVLPCIRHDYILSGRGSKLPVLELGTARLAGLNRAFPQLDQRGPNKCPVLRAPSYSNGRAL